MSRVATSKQIGELYRRAKYLLDYRGVDRPSDGEDRYISEFRTPLFFVLLDRDDRLSIHDQVAGCGEFDYQTGGVHACYGSTALNVLLNMRKIMVLDDLADV